MLLGIDARYHVDGLGLKKMDETALAHCLEVDFKGHVSLSIVSADRGFGGEW